MKALRVLASRLGVSAEYLETGAQLPMSALRELRLAELELQLRLEGAIDQHSLDALRDDAESRGDPAGAVRARILLGLAAAAAGDPPAAIAHLSAVLDFRARHPVTRARMSTRRSGTPTRSPARPTSPSRCSKTHSPRWPPRARTTVQPRCASRPT